MTCGQPLPSAQQLTSTSNQAWQQAELSLGRCGLGMRSLSQHSPAAYVASLSSSGAGPLSWEHLIHAVDLFNSLVPSSEAISIENVLTSPIHQKVLSNKIDSHRFNLLLEQSSPADRARLLSVSSPHAASWVSVIPSEGLGASSPAFRVPGGHQGVAGPRHLRWLNLSPVSWKSAGPPWPSCTHLQAWWRCCNPP